MSNYDLSKLLLKIIIVTITYIVLSYINTSILWDILFNKIVNKESALTENTLLHKLYIIMFRVLLNISITTIILTISNMLIFKIYLLMNILYLLTRTVYNYYSRENNTLKNINTRYFSALYSYLKANFYKTLLFLMLSASASMYILLPIITSKSYLIGDIRLHFMIIDGILKLGRITPYLSKYDIMLTYSPGLHASYAFLIYISNGVFNLLYFPLLIYGFYFVFFLMLTMTIYYYTSSIFKTFLASIIMLTVLPPSIGFHFFPAAHIFTFYFVPLILIDLYKRNIFMAFINASLTLLIHPVSGIAQVIIVLSAVLLNKNLKLFLYSILRKYLFQYIYTTTAILILSLHFIKVFCSKGNLIYFTAPAAYSKVLNINKHVLFNMLHSGINVLNYTWYTKLNNFYLSQVLIVLLVLYVVFKFISRRYTIKPTIIFNEGLLKMVCLWHIIIYSLLYFSVKFNLYFLMPTSFNRMIGYSVLLTLILVWSTDIITRKIFTKTLVYITLLVSIMGMNSLIIPYISTAYSTFSSRTNNYVYDVNVRVFNEIKSIVEDINSTTIVQVNAPLSVLSPLLNVKRIILLQPGVKRDIYSLPELILINPKTALQIVKENNISCYIMYFPSKNDNWLTRYLTRLLYKGMTNPYKTYVNNKSIIKEYFIILYDKYNYVVLVPRDN